MSAKPTVLCFGEILWDFLPDGLYVGGAPFNVAYHLHQHDVSAHLVSAVGNDLLGEELIRRMEAWRLPTDAVARLPDATTGYVRASLGKSGDAKYIITEGVAWDHISTPESVRRLAAKTDAVVFGSLAQRGEGNRKTLSGLLGTLRSAALRVFDVNLRPPYDDLNLIGTLAKSATLTKLNAEEAARLADDPAHPEGREEAHARAVAEASGCPLVCITAGGRGAGLLREGTWRWEEGRKVAVADTVGAGDSFLASLVAGLIKGGSSDGKLLARACRLGEWVATKRGATPSYDPSTPL